MSATPTQAEITSALSRWLAPGSILSQPEDVRPFETDGLTSYRQLPYVVVLPQTVRLSRRPSLQ